MPSLYVGITDADWHRRLSSDPSIDEVNFWQPSAGGGFRALPEGGLFLFKLKYPVNSIVGGARFAGYARLSLADAWNAFGTKNGVASLDEFVDRLTKLHPPLRQIPWLRRLNHQVGCILLVQPFWFDRSEWIPMPGWKGPTQRGRGYDVESEEGRQLWGEVLDRLSAAPFEELRDEVAAAARPRFGEPVLVRPRLGQGSFKVLVLEAYQRRCTVTGEHVVPVLEAAHIKPYSDGGEHRVTNGLLLRSDIHTLFDRGYISIDPAYRVRVDERLHDDFDNGAEYLAMNGRTILLPERALDRPDPQLLAWRLERLGA